MKPSIIEKCTLFVQSVRQEFDNILSCNIEHSDKKCVRSTCMRDLKRYVELSTSIEQNGPRVTNGEWTKEVKPILDEHPECGQNVSWESHSVEELFRVIRNLVGHRSPKDVHAEVLGKIRAKMVFLIMHGFAWHTLHISKDEVLMLFADTFTQTETAAYKEALEKGELTEVPLPHFKVKVSYKSGAEEETVCFFDVSMDMAAMKKVKML